MVCARFMRRAQAGGELLADDAAADVEADQQHRCPPNSASPVAARLHAAVEAALEAASGTAQRAASRPSARFRKAARRDTGCTAGAIGRRGAAGEGRTAARGSGGHATGRGNPLRRHAGAS